jgi:hypothetical protein
MAGGARAFFDRLMSDFRVFKRRREIRMALQAEIADRTLKKSLFRRLMGVMAFGAGPHCDRTVHERLLEWFSVMTFYAEISPVITHVKQIPTGTAMRFVTGQAVTFLYRWMHNFLFAEVVVAFCTEHGHPSHQFPAFPPLQHRVYQIFLLVTGEAFSFLYRGVHLVEADNRAVTCRDRAGHFIGVTLR